MDVSKLVEDSYKELALAYARTNWAKLIDNYMDMEREQILRESYGVTKEDLEMQELESMFRDEIDRLEEEELENLADEVADDDDEPILICKGNPRSRYKQSSMGGYPLKNYKSSKGIRLGCGRTNNRV